jgi:hypothetical protein
MDILSWDTAKFLLTGVDVAMDEADTVQKKGQVI